MERWLPAGAIDALRREVGPDLEHERLMTAVQSKCFAPLVTGEALDQTMAESRPDVMLGLCFLGLEALVIRYRYRMPVAILTPCIHDVSRQEYCRALVARLLNLSAGVNELVTLIQASGDAPRSLNDLADLLLACPELALYPRAFDLPDAERDPRVRHVGTGQPALRREAPGEWNGFDATRPLIYASLGSRPSDYGPAATRLFQAVIDAISPNSGWQLLASVGSGNGGPTVSADARHIRIAAWTPQVEALGRASVMVTHGGMGAVNECLMAGVPMVVCPLARDQHQNAARIVHHGLGLAADAATVSPGGLRELIGRVLADRGFAARVAAMRARCQESNVEDGVVMIESLMRS
jgi:MGT family glycosyltransferase